MKKGLAVALVTVATGFLSLEFVSYGNSFKASQVLASGAANQMNIPNYTHTGHLNNEDANLIAAIRQAGIKGDNTKTQTIIESLKRPTHRTYVYTCLHALAQLGAIEALPTIDTVIQNSQDQEGSNFARVAKARLIAEDSAKTIIDNRTRAVTKTKRFYKELSLTPADLNAGLKASQSPITDENGRISIATGGHKPHSVELYAVRELADLVYKDGYKDFADLAEVDQVDFQQDYASALKMRLAPLSRDQRLVTIIQELSRKTALTFNDYNEIQLAVNEGQVASHAAANELRKMESHRDQYNQINHHSGFTALFQVIAGVGDEQQAPLINHFKQDQDPAVRHYADIMYDDIAAGIKRESMPAY